MNNEKCCKKCNVNAVRFFGCLNPSCPCHTQAIPTPIRNRGVGVTWPPTDERGREAAPTSPTSESGKCDAECNNQGCNCKHPKPCCHSTLVRIASIPPTEEDYKGGTCSKCGAWKGGEYGVRADGTRDYHRCPTPPMDLVKHANGELKPAEAFELEKKAAIQRMVER